MPSIGFVTFGHCDVSIQTVSELHKNGINADLFFCFSQNRKKESVIDFEHLEVPNGFLVKSRNHEVFDDLLLEKYPLLTQVSIFIFQNLKFISIQNWRSALSLFKVLKRYKTVHFSGENGTWLILFTLLRLRGVRVIYSVHDLVDHSGQRIGFYVKYIRPILLRLSHYVVLMNQADFKKLSFRSRSLGRKSRFIPFGILDLYTSYQQGDCQCPKYDFLFFGRISQYKGMGLLLESLKRLKNSTQKLNFNVLIAGAGYDLALEELKTFKEVKILNEFQDSQTLACLIKNARAIICPYLDATQSGVLMTSFAFKKPVIATNSPSFEEVMSGGGLGVLVESGNADQLAQALQSFYNNSFQHESDFEFAIDRLTNFSRYSWSNIAAELIQIYKLS